MDIDNKIQYLKQILGYDILEKFTATLDSYKVQSMDSKEFNKLYKKTVLEFNKSIDNPSDYNLSNYQRDRRTKIEVIFDILVGNFFEDCFMNVFAKYSNKTISLNYDRSQNTKYTSDPDFCISGILKTYYVEFKTLKFKSYPKLPVKKSNITEADTIILLLNKETYDIYIIPSSEIAKYPLGQAWGKECYMIDKEDLDKFNKFNMNDSKSIKSASLFFK